MPRYWHTSAQLANKVVVYSGMTQDYSVQSRKGLASVVEVFDPHSEEWEHKQCTGQTPAPGVRSTASASCKSFLFTYGGRGGDDKLVSSLHKLSAKDYQWSKLPGKGQSPMPKEGAAMVVCGDFLTLFGGFGVPHSPTQCGSSFIKASWSIDSGYTNEFHIYHLDEGMHACT